MKSSAANAIGILISLISLTIDKFKAVIVTYGHVEGDKMLKTIA